MTDIVVMGGSGMLGSMVADVLSRDERFHVRATARTVAFVDSARLRVSEIDWRLLDIDDAPDIEVEKVLADARWVINAIGVTKPYIRDDNDSERERAIRVNSLFPHRLGRIAGQLGIEVIQIATDCVFTGSRGQYTEDDPHDAADVYGKTKSLGELTASHVHNLRCSIIGPEPKAPLFLLEWFLHQPQGSALKGFTNHLWNGITTLHFAKLSAALITDATVSGQQHVLPSGTITKADLLEEFATAFQRRDIRIERDAAAAPVDRTLASNDSEANSTLWKAAGYDEPPSIPGMIDELAAFDYRFAKG